MASILPETYYHDEKYEIRSLVGLMAPRQVVLIEKNWLTEKEVAWAEYPDGRITNIELLNATSDSVIARVSYEQITEVVTFTINR